MRHFFAPFFAPVLLAAALAGCGDGSGPSDVIPAELAGSWSADPGCLPAGCGFTFIPVGNAADSINVVAFMGLSMEVTLTRAGGFEMIARPGEIPPVTGQAEVEGSTLIVRDGQGAQDTLDFVVTPTRLVLTFRGTFDVLDFDGDQEPDPATARGTFRRR